MPEYNVRNPFVRWADSWYGQHEGRGEAADVFFGGAIGGWRPQMGSIVGDPTKEVGYFRFNTGNPTRDAIASIAMNELGIDNFVKAVLAADNGRYAESFKEILFAAGEMTFYGALPARGLYRAASRLRGVNRSFRSIPNVPRPAGFAVGSGGAGSTVAAPAAAAPDLATRLGTAVRHARTQTNIPRLGRGGRIAAVLGGLTTLGFVGNAMLRGTPREDAPTVAAATQDPDETPSVIRDIPGVSSDITEAGNNAREDVAGINRQYDNILRELQGMYQLSETEEERERLRFMLADIEAQRDAGLEAIAQGYAQTVAAIQQRGEISRQQSAERAERFGGQLSEYADQTAQRMMLQNVMQQQQFRGLGSGSQTPVNEWVGLMSAMAPLQQQYMQRMGDITGEGIDWLADTTSAQGQAQMADLQRLAAATRSASIMSHQRMVDDRIQREREQQRAAILQVMQQQAAAAGNIGALFDPMDRQRTIEEYALGAYGPGYIGRVLEGANQPGLTPSELAMIELNNQIALGLEPQAAADIPLDASGN